MKNDPSKYLNMDVASQALILDAITDGVIALDTKLNITFINEAATKILGKNTDTLIGKNLWKIFPEVEQSALGAALLKTLKSQEKQVIKDYFPFWNGFFSVNIYPSADGVLLIMQNTTDEYNTEKTVRGNDQMLQFLLTTTAELTEFKTSKQVYVYAAKKINQLLKEQCIVAVVEYNNEVNKWKMQHLEGIGKHLTRLSSLLKFDIQNLEGKISTKYYDQILSGKVSELPFDFPGFFNGVVSDRIGNAVKKLLQIEKMYCIGFKQNNQLFGNITFVTNPKTEAFDTELIEAFVAQIGNFVNRIKAEELQKETENQFRTYIENAPFGIFVTDKTGRYISVNEEACRITGYNKTELLNKKVTDIIDNQYLTHATNHFNQVISEGKAYEEVIGVNKAGERRWGRDTAIKINENEFLGFHQDITDRKTDTENLVNHKKYLEIILQTAKDGFWVLNNSGQLIDVNEAYCKMSGYSRQELLEMSIEDIDINENADETAAHIKKVMQNGSDFFQSRHRRKDGTIFNVEISVTYLENEGGQLVCFCRDISKRKQSQEKLLETTQYLESLISNANAPIIVWDADYKITRFNKAFELLTGYTELFIIGKRLDMLFPDEQAQTIMQFIRKSSKSYLQWETVEIPIKHIDGSIHILIWNSANILDKTGTNIISTIAQGQDITDRKKTEETNKELLKRFQILGDHLPGFIYQYRLRADKSSHFPYASPGISKIYGVEATEVMHDASAVFDVIHPEDLEQVRNSIEFSAYTLNPWHESYRVCLPEGKIIWVEGNSTPQKLDDGSIIWHGFVQDITSKKIVQDQLAKSEKHLQYLLDLHRISEKSDNEIRSFCLEASLDVTQSNFAFLATVSIDQKTLEVNTWSKAVMQACEIPVKQHIFDVEKIELLGASVKQQKTIVVNNYETTAEVKNGIPAGHVPIKRFLSIPVFSNNRIVAVGAVANKEANYTDADIRELSSLLYEFWNIAELKAGKNEIQKLSTAMQQSPASVVITNTDGIIEYVNPKFTEITGYSPIEVIGKKPNLLKSGRQPDSIYKNLWETIAANKEWRGELQNRKKDGSLFWEAVSISPILNQEGEKTHYIAIKEDITEKKATEQKLLEAHKISKLATFELHWESRQFHVSENMATIYGYDDTMELSFEEWFEFVYLEDRPMIIEMMNTAIGNSISEIDVSFRIVRKSDKAVRWIHVVGEILKDSSGEPTTLIGTSRDITEIKEYEYQLIAAKEKAEESNRLKNAFLQNLSHEIRTPLNGIIGFSELLNDPDLTKDDIVEYTNIIMERGWQLTAIINDILAISAIETGQEKIYNEEFNINELLQNHIRIFEMQAVAKGLDLRLESKLSSSCVKIISDKSKISQVLNNLTNNALKFTSKGEIAIGCSAKDEMLEFCVKDTGIGIDKSKLEVIFERFAQADDFIRRDFGGTGLGLSICKGFVQLMGGAIWVESEKGKGTEFHFTIPFTPVRDKVSNNEKKIDPDKNEKINVLVAEDEENNFLVLELILNKLKCNTFRAVNGKEAIKICNENSIDLVLMDIKMPEMDGYTAALKLKETHPLLPVVAQTAHAEQNEIQHFRHAFDAYITKPFTQEKIRQIIAEFQRKG